LFETLNMVIRQAHSYLAGAVSGTALIGAAVVAFVMLVSLQALKDWPLAGIGGGGDSAAVSEGQPASGAEGADAPGGAASAAAGKGANGVGQRQGGANSLGGQQGRNAAADASPAPSGDEVPSTNSTDGAGSTPSSISASGSGGGSGSGAGAGGKGGAGQSPSGTVAGTVNDTVSGVDQATGGALGETDVPKVTEEVVNGAAGSDSTVGKTVDKVVETVGGVLGGGK
jgi:hypothetical protein